MEKWLVRECTITKDGTGTEFALGPACDKLLLTLEITQTIQQQSLNISIWGSADQEHWRQLSAFPQKSYCGKYLSMLDLRYHPGVRYLRAQWGMSRWGLDDAVLASFCLSLEELKSQGPDAALAMSASAASRLNLPSREQNACDSKSGIQIRPT
jgi:hypothetical protein